MENAENKADRDNYLVIGVKIGDKNLRALLDTGAQPCVLKKSCVPIGTTIVKTNMCLKGINGPKVKVCGTAEVTLEVGTALITKNMVIVEDKDLDFQMERTSLLVLTYLSIIS